MLKNILLYTIIFISTTASHCSISPLEECWKQQVAPLQTTSISFQYTEVENNFSHSMNPWDQYQYNIKGNIHLNQASFYKSDTLVTSRNRTYFSSKNIRNEKLYFLDYGETELSAVSKSMLEEQLIHTCRYTPVLILDYFFKNNAKVLNISSVSTSYQANIGVYSVILEVSNATRTVSKIETLYDIESDDEYYGYGDVTDIYTYSDYKTMNETQVAQTIVIEKLNGKLQDQVSVTILQSNNSDMPELDNLGEPNKEEETATTPDITIEHYTKNIHFINLHHVGTRSMMVQFSDYILVAESPLNSENGKLLIEEIRKIEPNKPIKYFVFGHFHPHYTGGMRPFIHEGASIICTKEDQEYVKFIANASHAINPDALQLEPKKLQFDEVIDNKTISDTSQEMVIYHIGSKSNHTNDYLIYYFPKEKMLFQDDLVRIRTNSTKENLSRTTIGLYNAIKDLGIEVDDIVQNWSVFDKTKSMKFKFADIEKIMEE